MEDLGGKISKLSEDKKRYLEMMLAKKSGAGNETVESQNRRIRKRSVSMTRIPCSKLQTEFWYRWSLFPGRPTDNIAGYVRMKGKLDVSAAERAFHDIVVRHEVLRSKFIYAEGAVFAEIEPEVKCDIKIADYTGRTGAKQAGGPEVNQDQRLEGVAEHGCRAEGTVNQGQGPEDAANQGRGTEDIIEIMRHEASLPFDLSIGPLIRFRCYRTSADEWYLLMVQHHIISDGTSTNILIKEMLHNIERLQGMVKESFPGLDIQFYDYVLYRNEKLEKGEFDFQKEYWKKELKDCDMDLRLSDSPGADPDDLFGGGRVCFRVGKELNDRINRIGRKYTVTPFSFLLAAFRALLYRYTGQEDMVVVVPVQGRNEREAEALIGCFLNMLPIRNRLNAGESFIECVKRENRKVLDALEHQDIPFGPILKEMDIRSESIRTSVYHIVFSYEGNVMKNVALGNFEVEFDELSLGTTKSDLILELNQADDGLEGWFEYRTGRFSRQFIEMLRDAFLELLKNAAESESRPVGDINIMTEAGRNLVLSFGTGAEEKWELKTINRMFSDIAAAQPDREALIYAHDGEANDGTVHESTIYGGMANDGTVQEGTVHDGTAYDGAVQGGTVHKDAVQEGAVHEGTVHNSVAYGSMTYGELDRLSNRIARYLRHIGVENETIVALMMGKSAELFAAIMGVIKAGGAYLPIEPSYPEDRIRYMMEDSGANYLIYDKEYKGDLYFLPNICAIEYTEMELDILPDGRLPEYNTANSLAYVIYTSGTTGNPKGVMVEHRGVCNLTLHFQKYYGLVPGDRVLQFAHIVFDACVWEWALALLTGAALCIVKKETILDIPSFVKQIRDFGVTVVEFSPQYWKQISKEGLSFKLLLTAGSEADESLVRSASGSDIYVNGYGPTENTVGITLWTRYKNDEIPVKIPVGKPISNVQVYILDGNKLCGVGVTGEICAAGTDVARGYLNRPELTAEKFTDNPFGPGKLYHTGDYGRWLENGGIEFAGRIDGQVKIRGYRVETGEIETRLCKCDGVDAAAVAATENNGGDKALEAYLVLTKSLTVKEIDAFLKNILPFYMIPSRYYRVEAIPLNINGKTDFKALRNRGIPLESGRRYTEPATETERRIAAIWEKVLDAGPIGADDNFFERGGDSIKILQVISKAAEEGIRIELKSFYEDKTIRKIAENAAVAENSAARTGDAANDGAAAPDQMNSEIDSGDLEYILSKFG